MNPIDNIRNRRHEAPEESATAASLDVVLAPYQAVRAPRRDQTPARDDHRLLRELRRRIAPTAAPVDTRW